VSSNESPTQATPISGHSHYNPISVDTKEATGTAFLGVLAIILLLALLRAQRQNRELVMKLARQEERPF